MRKTIEVSLATIVLALILAKAAAAPMEGTWEGSRSGLKAVTLKIADVRGHLEGRIVFYVVDKTFGDRDARIIGQVERSLTGLNWDGRRLRFSLDNPELCFEMTPGSAGSAMLKRLATAHQPALAISMVRQ